MEIERINQTFSICKVEDFSQTDIDAEFCFIGRTDRERSLVCPTSMVPDNAIEQDEGWSAFRICGTLDFSLIGILAKISSALSEAGIGIFALSTFDTDYVLTKTADFERALAVLSAIGYVTH